MLQERNMIDSPSHFVPTTPCLRRYSRSPAAVVPVMRLDAVSQSPFILPTTPYYQSVPRTPQQDSPRLPDRQTRRNRHRAPSSQLCSTPGMSPSIRHGPHTPRAVGDLPPYPRTPVTPSTPASSLQVVPHIPTPKYAQEVPQLGGSSYSSPSVQSQGSQQAGYIPSPLHPAAVQACRYRHKHRHLKYSPASPSPLARTWNTSELAISQPSFGMERTHDSAGTGGNPRSGSKSTNSVNHSMVTPRKDTPKAGKKSTPSKREEVLIRRRSPNKSSSGAQTPTINLFSGGDIFG